MRGRLVLKLISVIVLLVVSIIGAKSLTGSSASSPINPVNVGHNGIAGLCANQAAVAQAGGQREGSSPATLVSPGELAQLQAGNPGGLSALTQSGSSLTCPTATTDP
jgi:hypothetical protein